MSILTSPNLKLELSGTGVTLTEISNNFVIENKLELSESIIDTDNDVTIDFSNIDSMKFIVMYSDTAFTVKITKGANRLSIPVEVDYPLVLPVSQTFMDSLTSIAINTASTTVIKVNVIAYGEDSA